MPTQPCPLLFYTAKVPQAANDLAAQFMFKRDPSGEGAIPGFSPLPTEAEEGRRRGREMPACAQSCGVRSPDHHILPRWKGLRPVEHRGHVGATFAEA